MTCSIELKVEDLKDVISSVSRQCYRKARNEKVPEIAKIYQDLGDHYANALQTIILIKK